MLKRCNISLLMGYEKAAFLYLLFHYTGKKDFQESTPKIQMLMIGLAQTSHFGLQDIIPPPESQLAFHIYYVKYKNTLTCKRISWDLGGNDVLKIFFYFLYV